MMKINIGMCPGYADTQWEKMGNPFIKSMIEALEEKQIAVTGITAEDLIYSDNDGLRKFDLLHFHWPGACYDMLQYNNKWFLNKIAAFLKKHKPARDLLRLNAWYNYLMQSVNTRIIVRAKNEIENWAEKLHEVGLPIVWQQHDLLTHTLKDTSDYMGEIDNLIHHQFYRLCDAIVIHELSCLEPVVNYYGENKKYSVAYLGPVNYGKKIDKQQALKSLNIENGKFIFSYIGTFRPNRNPEESLKAFIKLPYDNIKMIIAGQGIEPIMEKYHDSRIGYLPGLIKPDLIRDIYCASDFFVNDGKEYLTSMAVRNALAYGIPVIVHPFGSSIDMAKGAAIFIDEDGIGSAMQKALNMSKKERYRMKTNALANSNKRTWDHNAMALYKLYKELLENKEQNM